VTHGGLRAGPPHPDWASNALPLLEGIVGDSELRAVGKPWGRSANGAPDHRRRNEDN